MADRTEDDTLDAMRARAFVFGSFCTWAIVAACGGNDGEDAYVDAGAPPTDTPAPGPDATTTPSPGREDAATDATADRDAGADAAIDDLDATTDAGDELDASEESDATPNERTLFLGNSYTFFHDMPSARYRVLAPDTVRPFVQTVAYGGYFLSQHLADAEGTGMNNSLGPILGVSADAGTVSWNHVVLQEQSILPSLEGMSRDRAIAASTALSAYAHAAGATTVLYMTWGYAFGVPQFDFATFGEMQTELTLGYRAIAATLYEVDPTTFTGQIAGIDADTKTVLLQAAHDVVIPANVEPPAP